MIFDNKEYQVNIKDGVTFFVGLKSFSLGDQVMATAIKKQYEKDNPDEQVFYFENPAEWITRDMCYKPDKIFWRNVNFIPKPDGAIEFGLHGEVHELWKRGVYPELWFKSRCPEHVDKFPYGGDWIVLHIRNISKIKQKNTNPEFIWPILLKTLEWKGRKKTKRHIMLIGNDDKLGDYEGELLLIDYDFRKRWVHDDSSLSYLSCIIKHSKLYIGSDSGLAHLAGCCNVPMVCWGFESELWFPKVRHIDDCTFLTKDESKIEVITREIGRKLGI